MTQLQLAEAASLDPARISKYESGKDLSESVEDRIIQAFPETKNYIIDDPSPMTLKEAEVKYKSRYAELEAKYDAKVAELEQTKKMLEFLQLEFSKLSDRFGIIETINQKLMNR